MAVALPADGQRPVIARPHEGVDRDNAAGQRPAGGPCLCAGAEKLARRGRGVAVRLVDHEEVTTATTTASGDVLATFISGPGSQLSSVEARTCVLENGCPSLFVPPITIADPSGRATVAALVRGLLRLSAWRQVSVEGSYTSAASSLPGAARSLDGSSSPTTRTVPSPMSTASNPVRSRGIGAAR